ncbi:hypothetical protein EVAR_34498_1 [Eumeta japonica]|uniref:Uncharacterized protein n=1 Tax=Eumeta variegata TaxID=151549 RepID=A0A4C1Z8A9_EUMVA|nr:hypothetical protein EVAR_34498_1 [Eumeta japonica]
MPADASSTRRIKAYSIRVPFGLSYGGPPASPPANRYNPPTTRRFAPTDVRRGARGAVVPVAGRAALAAGGGRCTISIYFWNYESVFHCRVSTRKMSPGATRRTRPSAEARRFWTMVHARSRCGRSAAAVAAGASC